MTDPAFDRRAFARRLSLVADQTVSQALAARNSEQAPGARRIALTGPPGTGKSTLAGALARERLRHPGRIGVLAIDPSSPLTGGAVLGDRIRMESLAEEPRIFIRSLASRAAGAGLADNLPDLLGAFDAAGFVELIIETVGVGQTEHEIRHLADTIVIVLMPGAGDQIQMMKSGILETGDIYVVNKADSEGAERLAGELRSVAKLVGSRRGTWAAPVVLASATDGRGIAELSSAIDAHMRWLSESADRMNRVAARRACHVRLLLERRVREILSGLTPDEIREPIEQLYVNIATRLAAVEARDETQGKGSTA